MSCHSIKCTTMFFEFKHHDSLWKMWLRQRTVKIGLTLFGGLRPASIQWFGQKNHSQGIYNRMRITQTRVLMSSLICREVIIGLKCRILPHFMFIKVRRYVTAYFTTEDVRIQFSPPVNYLYGCHVAPVTVGPSDIILPERHHSRTPWS